MEDICQYMLQPLEFIPFDPGLSLGNLSPKKQPEAHK